MTAPRMLPMQRITNGVWHVRQFQLFYGFGTIDVPDKDYSHYYLTATITARITLDLRQLEPGEQRNEAPLVVKWNWAIDLPAEEVTLFEGSDTNLDAARDAAERALVKVFGSVDVIRADLAALNKTPGE